MPKRIQLSNSSKFRLDGAVRVDRGTKWENPFTVHRNDAIDDDGPLLHGPGGVLMNYVGEWATHRTDWSNVHARAVELFREHARTLDLSELRGKNLACWCPAGYPCHADVLVELANHEAADLPQLF